MKRSRMLEIIEKALEECPIVNTLPSMHILNCIEGAGMLPPNNGNNTGLGDCVADSECLMDHVSDCYWEQEDETL